MMETTAAAQQQTGTEGNWRRLLAAVLLRAALDAQDDDDPGLAAPARRWLRAGGAEWAEALEIPAGRVVAWVAELPGLPWEQLALWEEGWNDGETGPPGGDHRGGR